MIVLYVMLNTIVETGHNVGLVFDHSLSISIRAYCDESHQCLLTEFAKGCLECRIGKIWE